MSTRIPFVLVLAVGVLSGRASAQQRHPHAYDIQPDSGNYAICVISYMGDSAFGMAYDCVSELRANYELPAYFYSRTEVERKNEEARRDALRRHRHEFYDQMGLEWPDKFKFQTTKITDQYAVLVAAAAFKNIDTTRKALDSMRKLPPPSKRLLHVKTIHEAPVDDQKDRGKELEKGRDNPFLTAFVVPNPAAPKPKVNPAEERQEEGTLREWNSGETLSAVHKIPGKWTLVVRAYRGASRIVPQNQDRSLVERVTGVGRQGDLMDANAKSAHQLAEILRNPQLGFESYVVHTPKMSLVTVGAFDNKDDVRMMAVKNSLGRLHLNLQGASTASEPLESPTPWQVPRK